MTSASVGSTPIAIRIKAGARVIARRRKIGIRRSMNPCITTWPAIVPTDEEANPEASRATPKTIAAFSETVCRRPSKAPSMLSMPASPPPLNSAAAMTIIERLMTPASVIAITTSIFSKRRIRRRSSLLRPTIRRWVSAECR